MSADPTTFEPIARKLLDQPLACTMSHAGFLVASLRSDFRMPLAGSSPPGLSLVNRNARRLIGATPAKRRSAVRSSSRDEQRIFEAQDGVAIIRITGTLVQSWPYSQSWGYTGYEQVKAQILAAMDDNGIDAIWLWVDSPGGLVAGMLDLSDIVYACSKKNGGKLIYTMVDEQMASAAFCVGSGGDEVHVPRTGEVGSVGVLMIHAEYSDMNRQEGIGVTVFRSGAHKAEGNPYEKLSTDVITRFQGTIDEMRELFVGTVARNMGLTKKSVRETEALTYIGDHARGIGFATTVSSTDQAWMRLMKRLRRA